MEIEYLKIERLHNLIREIESTKDATMERKDLLELFKYVREMDEAYQLSCQRNNEANVKIGELNKEIGGYSGTIQALAEEMGFIQSRMKILNDKMLKI